MLNFFLFKRFFRIIVNNAFFISLRISLDRLDYTLLIIYNLRIRRSFLDLKLRLYIFFRIARYKYFKMLVFLFILVIE